MNPSSRPSALRRTNMKSQDGEKTEKMSNESDQEFIQSFKKKTWKNHESLEWIDN